MVNVSSMLSVSSGTDRVHGPTRDGSGVIRDHDGYDDAATAATAFNAMLGATWALLREQAVTGPRASPSQMFEPGGRDPREQRQAAMKADDRSSTLEARARHRPDPTNVEARLARQAGSGVHRDARTHAEAMRATQGLTESASPARDMVREGQPGTTSSSPFNGVGSRMDHGNPTGSTADLGANLAGDSLKTGDRVPVSAAPVQPVGASAAGSLRATPTALPAPRVADQVAQLLSTDRRGEAESPRAVSSSPAGDGARSSSTSSKAPSRPSPGPGANASNGTSQALRSESTEASDFDRLVRSIRLQSGARHSSARLHLHPPELGRVLIDVRLEQDGLRIKIRTQTRAAGELLAERATQLRAALEQQGIHVERFEVTSDLLGDATSEFGNPQGADATTTPGRGRYGANGVTVQAPEISEDGDEATTLGREAYGTAGARRRLDVKV